MRGAITVAELCQEYLKAARTGLVITRFQREKSPRTVVIDEGRISPFRGCDARAHRTASVRLFYHTPVCAGATCLRGLSSLAQEDSAFDRG